MSLAQRLNDLTHAAADAEEVKVSATYTQLVSWLECQAGQMPVRTGTKSVILCNNGRDFTLYNDVRKYFNIIRQRLEDGGVKAGIEENFKNENSIQFTWDS
jgi:hypothetical protein